MTNKLYTLEEATQLINKNRTLVIAGDESLLSKLPEGNWIGGTNPYLLGENGGQYTTEKLYIKDFTDICSESKTKFYSISEIDKITVDGYENGIIFVIVPGFSQVHYEFSIKAPNLKNQFINPLIGWVSGSKFEEIAPGIASCFIASECSKDKIAVMFMKLPDNKIGRIEIINVYKQGNGDIYTFPEDGFLNTDFFVNGQINNLYEYYEKNNIDWFLPLVANYAGASINIGLIKDDVNKRALFAAPVFKNVIYKIAQSKIEDYNTEFFRQLEKDKNCKIEYSYSCLYNYFNFNLEGKTIDGFTGTFTFGEFAYQLLNISFVYLVIENV